MNPADAKQCKGCGQLFVPDFNPFFCPSCLAHVGSVEAERRDRAPLETAEVKTREIARILKGVMPKEWGFFLCLASFGADGFFTYMSSLERKAAIKLLRETADKLEKGEASR